MDDEPFYEQVAAEVAAGELKPGLWAKAFSEAAGNEAVAKAMYIRLRADQLLLTARHANAAARRQERATMWPERRSRIGRRIMGIVLLAFSLLFVLGLFADGGAKGAAIMLALFFGVPGYFLVRG